MPDADDAIAGLAVDLNEEAKANRRRKPKADTAAETDAGLSEGEHEATQLGYNAEAEHSTAVQRMENIADELDLAPEEMVFDIRDFLLDTIKARPKPWSATSQAEQRDVAAACEHAANELVRKVVEAVASRGVTPVRVLLTKVTLGTDMVIAGKVKTFTPEEEDMAVETLHRAIGKHVMLTVATTADYKQGGRDAETDPDEPDLDFAASGEDDDG